jgi:2-oxoisovalerate dehydrogenase E1 component alpha subunit
MHIECCLLWHCCCVAGVQGRFSFYMTCTGEEATVVGSAAGLDPKDMVSCRAALPCQQQRMCVGGRALLLTALGPNERRRTCLCCCLPASQVFSQYREHGVLVWRGFTFDDFANQVSGPAARQALARQAERLPVAASLP